jgi:hypothetical protein
MTVIIDAFITTQHAYYTTSGKADLTSALTFLMEDMTREARVSEYYRCAWDIASEPVCSSSDFAMTHIEGILETATDATPADDDEYVMYSRSGTKIVKRDEDGTEDMTAPDLIVTDFEVYVLGDEEDSSVRARVTLSAYYDENSNGSQDSNELDMYLQTSFTARI